MKEAPETYPLTRRPYAVAKDEPLLKIVEQQKELQDLSNDELDELVACIAKIQRTRNLVDVAKIDLEIKARLEMMPTETLTSDVKTDI